jgi:hypothetical protein
LSLRFVLLGKIILSMRALLRPSSLFLSQAFRQAARSLRVRLLWRKFARAEQKASQGLWFGAFVAPWIERTASGLADDLLSPDALRPLLRRDPMKALALVSLRLRIAPDAIGEALFQDALSAVPRSFFYDESVVDNLSGCSQDGAGQQGIPLVGSFWIDNVQGALDGFGFAQRLAAAGARAPFAFLVRQADTRALDADWTDLIRSFSDGPRLRETPLSSPRSLFRASQSDFCREVDPLEVWREKMLGRAMVNSLHPFARSVVSADDILASPGFAFFREHEPGEGFDAAIGMAAQWAPDVVPALIEHLSREDALGRLRLRRESETPLMRAARGGSLEVVQRLLPLSDPFALDASKRSAAMLACGRSVGGSANAARCALALVEAMRSKPESLSAPASDGTGMMGQASLHGMPLVVERLLDLGFFGGRAPDGSAPICGLIGSEGASFELLSRLARATDFGAKPAADRARASEPMTPFARLGVSALPADEVRRRLRLLTEHGADPAALDREGRPALAAAAAGAWDFRVGGLGALSVFAEELDPAAPDLAGRCALENFIALFSGSKISFAPDQEARARQVCEILRDSLLRRHREDLLAKAFELAACARSRLFCDALAEHSPNDWRRALPKKARRHLAGMASEAAPRWAAVEEARALRESIATPTPSKGAPACPLDGDSPSAGSGVGSAERMRSARPARAAKRI